MWGCGPRIGSFLLFGEIRYNFAVEMISNEYLDDLNNVTIKAGFQLLRTEGSSGSVFSCWVWSWFSPGNLNVLRNSRELDILYDFNTTHHNLFLPYEYSAFETGWWYVLWVMGSVETGKATRVRTEDLEGKVSDYWNKTLISRSNLITQILWVVHLKFEQNSDIAFSTKCGLSATF